MTTSMALPFTPARRHSPCYGDFIERTLLSQIEGADEGVQASAVEGVGEGVGEGVSEGAFLIINSMRYFVMGESGSGGSEASGCACLLTSPLPPGDCPT